MPRAAGLAAEIKELFGVEPELIPGSGGVFDVRADGKLVFSKQEVGRFPEGDEVVTRLEKLGLKHK